MESNIKKKFDVQELLDLGLPPHKWRKPHESIIVISNTIVEHSRWSVDHELIFRFADQPEDEAWLVYYSEGATETQDQEPWEDEIEVEAKLVKQKTKTITVWE